MTVRYISLSTRSTYLLPICLTLLLATFAQSYPATFLSLLNYSLLALCQKNPTPKLISWHTAKKSQLGAGTYLYCTYKIYYIVHMHIKHAWSTKVCRILLNDSFTFFLQYMGLWKIQEQQKQPFKSWISNVSWGKCSKFRKKSNLGKASKININVFRKNSNRCLCKEEKN